MRFSDILVTSFPFGKQNKKADVAEYPKAFCHVGLLFNEPPGGAELFLI